LGIVGCTGGGSSDPATEDDDLQKVGGALSCTPESGKDKIALVSAGKGKYALLTLTPAKDVFALSGVTGTLKTSGASRSFEAGSTKLDLDGGLKGTLKRGAQSTKVSCSGGTATDAATYRTANALVGYAGEIDGLADTITEEMASGSSPKPFTVFVVETSKRSSLDLGTNEKDSTGALPGDDDAQSRLDENDSSYGAMSAAYGLGGGDDYGEWFQGASDGISLSGDVIPALGTAAKGGFIAHSKVKALSSLVDGKDPSAVEITVGAWTFLVPDAFPK
jgi:hypothetical protein